ncbi:hypothetical protein BSZ19_09550 [Bradyrhizobium japonicum]|uniref:Uncharacterized protein n=1 Tax=Bradyrhizobium japonicum TaxID=375 RepID=A0A1Y2JTF8_BRAJP|nr:hypothetical protein BSZ19_09550 [Bradyrhizobium japonicum]
MLAASINPQHDRECAEMKARRARGEKLDSETRSTLMRCVCGTTFDSRNPAESYHLRRASRKGLPMKHAESRLYADPEAAASQCRPCGQPLRTSGEPQAPPSAAFAAAGLGA